MEGEEPGPPFERLAREHRDLDDRFGRFLAAASAGDAVSAREAIEEFDRELRRHTEREEREIYALPAGKKLAPLEGEDARSRLYREMRLEHVQVRELSGMIGRLLAEKEDLERVGPLAASLARRWDAHTAREEREIFGSGSG